MSYKARKLLSLLGITFLLAASLSGCTSSGSEGDSGDTSHSSGTGTSDAEKNAETATSAAVRLDASEMFTNRDKETGYDETSDIITLADGASSSDSSSVTINEDTITIIAEGTYILRGSLTNGQIQVDADATAKIQLVLDNVDLTCDSDAAIYIASADKVFLTMAEGSYNSVSSTGNFSTEDNIDGAIFSREDLTLNGNGSLVVSCETGHGIVSKDDLVLTSGAYHITSAKNALSGKDSIRIADGDYTLTAGNDTIHSENTDDTDKGFIYISGGTFSLTSTGTDGGDGIDASNIVQIEGGDYTIHTAYGKGVKSDLAIFLDGSSMTVDSLDDAFHSNSSLEVTAGNYTITTEDDGMHADEELVISGGEIQILNSYEGIEAMSITISGGDISLISTDDGINAGGGTDSSGFGGNFSRDNFGGNSGDYSLTISGGTISINANGDGLDSNGVLTVTGGEIYISGPTNSADSSFDYETSATITGGIVVAAGSSGMAENFSSSSTQGAMMINLSGTQSGIITLTDAEGNVLVTYEPKKQYNNVIISCPELENGETYTLTTGSSSTEVEMTSLIYSNGGGMGGFGGKGGDGNMGGPGGGDFGGKGSIDENDGTGGGRKDITDGDMEFPDGDLELPDGDMGFPEGDMEFPDGDMGFPEGGMELPDGDMELPEGAPDNPTNEESSSSA